VINVAEKKFLVDLNLTGNKAKNFRLEDYSDNTAPTSNFVGRMIYTTTGTDRIEFYNGSSWVKLAHYDELSSGSVTSIGIALDTAAANVFGVSNSPITSTGDITLSLDTQSPNYVFAGPATGETSAAPTFRALVAADIPSLSSIYQPLDGDLTAIAALSGTSGFLKKTAADTYTLDTSTYLTSFTETDPIFTASAAAGIDSTDITNWDTAYGWGNHASAGYAPINNPSFTGTVTVPTSIVFEGATANDFETTLTATDPTADHTITLPDVTGTVLTTGNLHNITEFGVLVSPIVFEGSTANDFETTLTVVDPDADRTITLPNASGTVALFDGSGNLTVPGNLTVSGDTTTLNTATLTVEDNLVVLNSNVTGTPTLNAGLEIERGDYTNASLYWDETANSWYVATPGDSGSAATATALSLAGHTHSTGDITGLQEYVEDTIATSLTDSGTIDFSYTDNSTSAGTITAAVILAASNPYLNTTSGLAVDLSTLEPKLVTDGFAKKYSTTIGDAAAQTFAVTHSLGTRAVTVSVYETASPYAEVEVEVLHTSTSVVTINTNSVPTSGQYTVVVVG
jgi:hypothetical protein